MVWRGDDHLPPVSERFTGPGEQRARQEEVFDDLGRDDDVELAVQRLRQGIADVVHQEFDFWKRRPRHLDPARREIDAGHPHAGSGDTGRQRPVPTPEVEHPAPTLRTERPQHTGHQIVVVGCFAGEHPLRVGGFDHCICLHTQLMPGAHPAVVQQAQPALG